MTAIAETVAATIFLLFFFIIFLFLLTPLNATCAGLCRTRRPGGKMPFGYCFSVSKVVIFHKRRKVLQAKSEKTAKRPLLHKPIFLQSPHCERQEGNPEF